MVKSMGKKKNQKREPYVPMPPQKKEGKKLSTTATNVYPPLSNTPAKNLNKIMVKKMLNMIVHLKHVLVIFDY